MSHILKDNLGLGAYKRRSGHFLTDNLKKNRNIISKQTKFIGNNIVCSFKQPMLIVIQLKRCVV